MVGIQKAIVALSAVGLVVLLLNMFGNRPSFYVSDPRLSVDGSQPAFQTSSQNLREATNESGLDRDLQLKLDAKLWGKPGLPLESCWSNQLPTRSGKAWGFVVVTTSNGPHNHRAQIADAVVVASQLGASLILPNIKEALKEPNSRFEDIYNVKNFIASLEGIVRVVGRNPMDMEKLNGTFTRIPLGVTREYIDEKVRPIFKEQGGLVYLGAFVPAIKGGEVDQEVSAIRCLVMHKALQYVYFIQKLGDRVLSRLREAAPESSGRRFVAVDLHLDLLQHKTCNVTDVKKQRCLEPEAVGQFLKRLGYPTSTAIYLTQSRWDSRLEFLQEMFPNVHTKEYSMPFNEENQYLFSGKTQFEQAVDFYICSRSDVFVSTVSGVFYTHVTGSRILAGLNHVIVPSFRRQQNSTKVEVSGVISPYVVKKNHPVYLCTCKRSLNASDNGRKKISLPPALESNGLSVLRRIYLEKWQGKSQIEVSL